MPPDEQDLQHSRLDDLANLVFEDLEEAAQALPKKEQDAYGEAQESVVEARRHAETKEGLLRVK